MLMSDYRLVASVGTALRGEPVDASWNPELAEAVPATDYAAY
jgi:hypothetical protein